MHICILKENSPNETRVAFTPEVTRKIIKLGFKISIEEGAGLKANFYDKDYQDAGARIEKDSLSLWKIADLIIKVNSLTTTELQLMKEGSTIIAMLKPAQNKDILKILASKKINALSIDSLPRISRAQKMDVLSSMANIAGYRAVIEAANVFPRLFIGQITAAGKMPPAKILVIGAGVAGLSAIGIAVSMGAVVKAFDTRLEVKEQITSMGAEFLQLEFSETNKNSPSTGYAKTMSKEFIDAEMALFRCQAKEVDIIITTALIPGKKAPLLITKNMVESMQAGSVIVDMATAQGGNCELSQANKIVTTNNKVQIIGFTNLVAKMPTQASMLFANNIYQMINELSPEKDGNLNLNMEDVVIRNLTVVKDGNITWPAPPLPSNSSPVKKQPVEIKKNPTNKNNKKLSNLLIIFGVLGLVIVGNYSSISFIEQLSIFILSCIIGYQVVWNVTPSLHTPLMSVTNAISGIIIIGALLQGQREDGSYYLLDILSILSILIATINIVGGFVVTHRMLKMFVKKN